MSIDNRLKRLIEVAYMYYIDGLSQNAIAKKMSISRSMVSLLLSEARLKEIVQIQIKNSELYCFDLERKLEKIFGLKRAIVIPSQSEDIKNQSVVVQLADATGEYLNQILEDNMTIALSWGEILYEMAKRFNYASKKNILVTPFIGGISTEINEFHAGLIGRLLAKRLEGKALNIYAPLFVSSKLIKDTLLKDKSISSVIKKAEQADIAILSMGSINNSVMKDINIFDENTYEQLIGNDAIGNISTWFFNKEGHFVDSEISDRTIAIEKEKLRQVPYCIAVGGGKENLEAIHSALKSQLMNIIITEESVAIDIINHYNI